MQPEPGSPEDWLRYARADLALAKASSQDGVMLELLCFHCQQAAEKSLKAVLINAGIEPPRTHVVERLVELLPEELERSEFLLRAGELTEHATITRYPGFPEPVSFEDYEAALHLAELIYIWASELVTKSKPN